MEFPWRCNVDTIAMDLKVSWEMSDQLCGTVQLKSGRVKKVDRNEVLELYDQTEAEAEIRVVEHWRRDVDYLSAIRELGRSRETGAGLDRR